MLCVLAALVQLAAGGFYVCRFGQVGILVFFLVSTKLYMCYEGNIIFGF